MRAEEGGAIKSRGLPKGDILQAGQHFARRPILEVVRGATQALRSDPPVKQAPVTHIAKQAAYTSPFPMLLNEGFVVEMVGGKSLTECLARSAADCTRVALESQKGVILLGSDTILRPDIPPVGSSTSGLRILVVAAATSICFRMGRRGFVWHEG